MNRRPAEGRADARAAGLRVLDPRAEPAAEARSEADGALGIAALRERLGDDLADGGSGRFWRSLEELAGTEEFQQSASRELLRYLPADGVESSGDAALDRRQLLKLAAASLAFGGLTACTKQPEERIVPYVSQPEELVPGKPLHFATTTTLGGYATGLLVESHMGRPTKVEGNPEHPASRGASDLRAQASVLDLYDPDRARAVTHLSRLTTWEAFAEAVRGTVLAQEALGGAGLRVLTGTVTSPTLAAQLEALQERFPAARWHQFEPVSRDGVREGGRLAFGDWAAARYDVEKADVVLTLDADLFGEGPGHLAYARQLGARRRAHGGGAPLRLYAAECSPTGTGTLADHRLAMRAGAIPHLALALAAELGVPGAAAPTGLPEAHAAWVRAAAEDLRAHPGACLVVAGETASADLHALVHGINDALDNLGSTVLVTDPVEARPEDHLASLTELVADMEAGRVDLLLILGGNPLFTAPADLGFGKALEKVDQRVYLGTAIDETAERCQWTVPEAHYLEGWSDARAFDGTVSVVQPLIEPLYGGKTAHQLLALFTGEPAAGAYELVERHWREALGAGFDTAWRRALHDGVLADSALEPRAVSTDGAAVAAAAGRLAGAASLPESLELAFRPDPSLWDGRFANNSWLQEVPRPVTKLTWDNALLIAPATVKRLGLEGPERSDPLPKQLHGAEAEAARLVAASGKVVKLTVGERSLEVPLWVVPGQADGTLLLHLGHGRRRAGRVGDGVGFDAYPVRTAEALWLAPGVTIEDTGRTHELASTQLHHNIPLEGTEAEHRHLVRTTTREAYAANPQVVQEMGHAEMADISLLPGWSYEGYRWGMSIDLNACLGCNACVVACQAENNIPVVGKTEVIRGREMHWMRIDRYYAGESLDEPEIHHQPVACMHCEQAPCELVCPVAATVHGAEGLNEMVYNRCVGTRYCSNNCPYKVRRFNFFNFNERDPNGAPELAMGRNPDVTVRFRGVMEKCTYCVQRINESRIAAKLEDRKIRDGEVETACQQACPTRAIAFGDVNDEASEVSRWKASELSYGLLEELGTRPQTTYLAKVKNPNPALAGAGASGGRGGQSDHDDQGGHSGEAS